MLVKDELLFEKNSGLDFREVASFVESLVIEIRGIPNTKESSVNLASANFFSKDELFNRIKEHLDKSKLLEILEGDIGLGYSSGLEMENIEFLDKLLVIVANSNVDTDQKFSFFSNFGAELDDMFEKRITEVFLREEGITKISECPLPIEVSYVLNATAVKVKGLGIAEVRVKVDEGDSLYGSLRGMKLKIESMESKVLAFGESICFEFGKNISELKTARFPRTGDEWKLHELYKFSQGQIVDKWEECLASLQLLRIYRELVNSKIAANTFTGNLIESQYNRNYSTFMDRYKGIDRSVNILHKFYSRFMYMHFGLSLVDTLSESPIFKNTLSVYVPVPSILVKAFDPRSVDKYSEDSKHVIRLFKDKHPDLVEMYKLKSSEKVSIETAILYISQVLERLGLQSDPDLVEIQLKAYKSGEELNQAPSTLAIYRDPKKKAFAMNSEYGVLRFPENAQYTWSQLVEITAMHELTHFIQKITFRQIGIPGVLGLSSLGRSGVLGESGAIKMQGFASGLRIDSTKSSEKSYHLLGLLKVMEGGNFWEAFNEMWKSSKNIDQVFSKVYRRLMRVYNNIGATAAPSQDVFRYPSSYSLLEYVLQGMPEYTEVFPFVSSFPSDKLEQYITFFSSPVIDPNVMLYVAIDSMAKIISQQGS